MPTVRAVEHVLLRAGEPRVTDRTSGFQVRAAGRGTVTVRWCTPDGEPAAGAGVSFLEAYAPILRDAGISAVVTTDRLGPRVLCLPGPVIGRRPSRAAAIRDAS